MRFLPHAEEWPQPAAELLSGAVKWKLCQGGGSVVCGRWLRRLSLDSCVKEWDQICKDQKKKKKIQTNRSFFSKPKVWISTSGVHMGTSNFEVLIEVRTETQTEEAALGYFHTVCHQTRLDLVVLERHPSRRWLWNVISTISAYWHHPDLNLTQVPTNS